MLRSKCFLELLILLKHRIRDAGASRRLNFCSKISGELLELTHTGCTMGIVDAVENPVGFHSTTSAVSFSFFSASADKRFASMNRSRRLASCWMYGSSKSEIWVLERELRKAFSCSSTSAGVPGVQNATNLRSPRFYRFMKADRAADYFAVHASDSNSANTFPFAFCVCQHVLAIWR